MSKTNLLILTHEMNPFLHLTQVADLLNQLPCSLSAKGYDIRILMPKFGCINERRNRLHEVIRLSGINIVVNENDNPLIIKVASLPLAKLQVYFLDNEDYFQRKFAIRDSKEQFYIDNDERTIFYCKGALETIKKLGWSPDIIHCNDWMTALVPMYLRKNYASDPVFKNAKIVYSTSALDYQEKMPKINEKCIAGNVIPSDVEVLTNDTSCYGLDKIAIHYSDAVIKIGENISKELQQYIIKSEKPHIDFAHEGDMSAIVKLYEDILSESFVNVNV